MLLDELRLTRFQTAEALIKYGALLVKDSRVTEDANDRFLDLLEDYFDQPTELLEPDCRPEFYYQGSSSRCCASGRADPS